MKKLLILSLMISTAFVSCNNDDDTPPEAEMADIQIFFQQNWDAQSVNPSDLSTTVYTNEFGHELIINRLRYLISNVRFTNDEGTVFEMDGYNLIDISDTDTYDFESTMQLPSGSYTMSFTYGFNEEDNVDGAYNDLNVASWAWPQMLGGGYHFMQFDGMYDVTTTAPKPFNYHNGTARVSEGVFEQNFIDVNGGQVEIAPSNTINITMNIAEWFKNPYTWNLDVYNTPLMPNYEAQKLMNDNGQTVFSVTQDFPDL